MALLNNYYIFVEKEDVTHGVNVTSHPVEQGLDLTDNIKRQPLKISLSGEIVGKDATGKLANIVALHTNGKLVRYVGRNILNNAIVSDFKTSHPNTITGGCSFDMELTEIRIANSPYGSSSVGLQKVVTSTPKKSQRYYTVKKGDSLWNIAKSFYGNGTKWSLIYNANKEMIDKRNKGRVVDRYTIYPKQVLVIPNPEY